MSHWYHKVVLSPSHFSFGNIFFLITLVIFFYASTPGSQTRSIAKSSTGVRPILKHIFDVTPNKKDVSPQFCQSQWNIKPIAIWQFPYVPSGPTHIEATDSHRWHLYWQKWDNIEYTRWSRTVNLTVTHSGEKTTQMKCPLEIILKKRYSTSLCLNYHPDSTCNIPIKPRGWPIWWRQPGVLSVFADQGWRPIVNVSTLHFRVSAVWLPRSIMWLTRVLASWWYTVLSAFPATHLSWPAAALSWSLCGCLYDPVLPVYQCTVAPASDDTRPATSHYSSVAEGDSSRWTRLQYYLSKREGWCDCS